MKIRSFTTALACLLALHSDVSAFCGFYVAKADTKIFNQASKVVLVRHDDKTVLTMVNDFQGDAKDFAVVIPVPTALEKGQIHVGNQATVDHLDAYSAPRLVEYWDPDPCQAMPVMAMSAMPMSRAKDAQSGGERDKALGVKVEAQYTVGEYDIVILSAEQSDGLETWLTENGYKIPAGASDVLGGYIKQKMHFFVAKVNLEEKAKAGFNFLRPIQVAYESPKFMLPIRLGMVNANGPQELFIFALSARGRVETTNYRTVKLPSGMDVPLYVKDAFSDFYRAMFAEQVRQQDMRAVFEEYAWDMSWCDPCAAEPLSAEETARPGRVLAGRRGPGGGPADPARPAADPSHAADGRRGAKRVRDAAAPALRQRALPRGPRLPGNRRPHELPGALRAPPPLDGRGQVRGGQELPRHAARAAAHRCPHPGRPDRLEGRGYLRKNGPARGWTRPGVG